MTTSLQSTALALHQRLVSDDPRALSEIFELFEDHLSSVVRSTVPKLIDSGWLNFVTSELHKTYGPFFRPTTPEEYKKISKENLSKRFDWIDKQLAGKQYLMGDKFTIADACMYTVLRWSPRIEIDLVKWPNIKAYMDRISARPKVQEALKAEGLQ